MIAPQAPAAELPAAAPEAPVEPPVEAPAPEPEPNRASCADIRGSDYLSPTERDWFIDNCMTAAAQNRLAQATAAGDVTAASTVIAPATAGGSTIEQFIAGYRDAGGPEAHLNRIVTRVIPCESGGNPSAYSSVGPFYGLMQFLGSTWSAMGGGDWHSPYQQGANTARLVQRANPATQWPVCWFR